MQKRKLGNSGISVAPLAFGGNVFGWTIDEMLLLILVLIWLILPMYIRLGCQATAVVNPKLL